LNILSTAETYSIKSIENANSLKKF